MFRSGPAWFLLIGRLSSNSYRACLPTSWEGQGSAEITQSHPVDESKKSHRSWRSAMEIWRGRESQQSQITLFLNTLGFLIGAWVIYERKITNTYSLLFVQPQCCQWHFKLNNIINAFQLEYTNIKSVCGHHKCSFVLVVWQFIVHKIKKCTQWVILGTPAL